MKLLAITSLILAACAECASAATIAQYYPAYSSQQPRSVPYGSMDIAIYFTTVTTSTGIAVPDYQADPSDFVTRAHAAGKKATFAVGGWTGSKYFSTLTSTASKRQALANKIKAFQDLHNFDGVDLDWEYPNAPGIGCNTISSSDAANFLAFITVLRSTLGSKIISAAVSVNGIIGPDGNTLTNLGQYSRSLSYLHLMSYDIGGPWSPTTGPVGPLRTCQSDTSIEQAVKLWTSRGFPASKILIGIPSYGVSYTTKSSTLTTKDNSQIYQAWTGVVPKGMAGDSNAASTDQCGVTTASYNGQWNLKALIAEGILNASGTAGVNGYTRYFDACTQTPFVFHPAKRHMICYDDAQSVGAKAAWAKQNGLGGVFFFDTTGNNAAVYTAAKKVY